MPTCNGATCNAEITFLKTKRGKWIPVDTNDTALEYAREKRVFDRDVEDLVPHHSTCPDAKSFRRKRETKA